MKNAKFKTDCWIWMYGKNSNGYGNIGRNGKIQDAHRFMYELLKGKVPHGCELDHLCKNKLCVNPEHLEPVSHAVNCRRGKNAKLNPDDIKEIRKLSKSLSQSKIAKKYNVSRQCIGYILQGKRWK